MKFTVFLIVLTFFQFLCSQEQQINNFKGVVLDKTTHQTIPFVHFSYAKKKGFVSNEKRAFQIIESFESIKVKVSAIGYISQKIDLKPNKKEVIYLDNNIELLNEVELVLFDQKKELLKRVIEKIPTNYPHQNETITGIIHEEFFGDSLFQDTIYKARYNIQSNKK